MLDFILVDNAVMMQISFLIMLFLSLLTASIYFFDVSNKKIKFMVLGNISFLLVHGMVLLSINGIVKLPLFVGVFDVLSVTCYTIAIFHLFDVKYKKSRFIILNLIHALVLLYFILVMEQVSILRMITSLIISIMIIDSIVIIYSQNKLVRIHSTPNLIINVFSFLIYKLLLFTNRVYTMNIEVGIASINNSINIFTFIGVLLVIWINFTIMFINYDLLNAQYKHLSYHDYLTNIPNRRYAMSKLQEALKDCERYDAMFALLMIDLDDFKKYNDEFGHDFGDELLVDFVQKFRTLIRTNDLFSRYGGDEFLLLLRINSREEITYFLRRVSSYFEKVCLTSKEIKITFSVGKVYIEKGTFKDIEDLIELVDQDLYKEKKEGK